MTVVFGTLLNILEAKMETPLPYGGFHLLFFLLSFLAGIVLCRLFPHGTERQARTLILSVSVTLILLELYKQLVYTFSFDGEVITADYPWYSFPFQFCSTPMYAGLIAALTKGCVHRAMCAYLGTYAVFAGLCVMLYPNDVFVDLIGINLQTMLCHGSMITVGIYLMYTGYVKTEHKTILKAIPVFGGFLLCAVILNEIAYHTGLTANETFNMFFISPHCEPSLPVYSAVQNAVPYPWCLLIYIAAFTLAAYLVLLLFMGIRQIKRRRS